MLPYTYNGGNDAIRKPIFCSKSYYILFFYIFYLSLSRDISIINAQMREHSSPPLPAHTPPYNTPISHVYITHISSGIIN